MILRTLMEYASILVLSIYSLISFFFIVSMAFWNFFLFLVLHESTTELYLFLLGLVLVFGHYTVLIVCLTCTSKLQHLADKICLPIRACLYTRIKQASKAVKLLTFMTHFIQTMYMMQFLQFYYDEHTHQISDKYQSLPRVMIQGCIYINVTQFINQAILTTNAVILLGFHVLFS